MIIVDKYFVVKSHNTHRNKEISFYVSYTDKECLLSNGSDCVRKFLPANFIISDYTYSLKSRGEFSLQYLTQRLVASSLSAPGI